MKINPFYLERYFAKYEFNSRHLLSCSDCESLSMHELIERADAESLRLWENLKLGYTESQGHPLLREEIAGLYKNLGKDDILATVPEEGIFIAMNAVLNPGDRIIVTTPAYQSLYEIARSLGCTVTGWPLTVKDGRWSLDLEFLRKELTGRTKMLVVNFPNNPTGYLPTQEFFRDLLALVNEAGIYLFSDEMYRLLEHEEGRRLPCAADVCQRAVSLCGLSKSFGLPGLRLGWLVTGDRTLMERFRQLKDYTTICGSAPAEILGIMALRDRDEIVPRNLRIIRENLGVSREFFTEHSHLFTWLEPEGGSIAFPELTAKLSVMDFCESAVKEKSIMILPGPVLDFSGNHFRVGYGRSNLPSVYRELHGFLREKRLL